MYWYSNPFPRKSSNGSPNLDVTWKNKNQITKYDDTFKLTISLIKQFHGIITTIVNVEETVTIELNIIDL